MVSREEEQLDVNGEITRDWARWFWPALIVALILMILLLWAGQRPKPRASAVRARHILITFNVNDAVDRSRALQRAMEIRGRLLHGESFEFLARQYSDDSYSARRGGDLGWAERGTYEKEFDTYCWQAQIGEISDIIQTKHGFHIIQVTDRYISDAERYEMELEERARSAAGGAQESGEKPEAAPQAP
ncbi:MAG TPA: peptidylprolyl isomerase [Candidatus Hydrogenedentes bacterium]|nr:peptidylprolyl isomerase [Candidatus Hydrogenedentota bacterium]